jgi:hypothetical protein
VCSSDLRVSPVAVIDPFIPHFFPLDVIWRLPCSAKWGIVYR